MPLYEFQCKACGHVNELQMKLADPPPQACGRCAEGPLVKLISRTNFVLKGQGWYETDFKNKAKPQGGGRAADESPAVAKAADSSPSTSPSSAATSVSGDLGKSSREQSNKSETKETDAKKAPTRPNSANA